MRYASYFEPKHIIANETQVRVKQNSHWRQAKSTPDRTVLRTFEVRVELAHQRSACDSAKLKTSQGDSAVPERRAARSLEERRKEFHVPILRIG